MILRLNLAIAGAIAATVLSSHAAAPELSIPGPSTAPRFVPVGKTLVIPVAGSDAEGGVLSYSVKTSNAKINARVRTGNPHYRVGVHTDNDGSVVGTPTPFDGEMEFQLFRHATPQTVDLIAGVAQSGYYDDVRFHRIVPGFVLQGGDKAGTGSGVSPFDIPHEFRPELIYTGRGQLAMANSQGGYKQAFPFNGNFQYSTANFTPTNGTQFFVTLGQPRHLDFKHTMFGQIIRGFDTMDHLATVPRTGETPTTIVKMVSHGIFASKTDAVILISAISDGVAEVTVTAEDPDGEKASVTIGLNAVVDTVNDPPIIRPLAPTVAKVGSFPPITVISEDLESDAISTRFPLRDNSTGQTIYASLSAANLLATARPNPGAWDLTIGVGAINDPLLDSSPIDAMRFEKLEIGVGDKPVVGTEQTITSDAGVSTGSVVLATFRHGSFGTSGLDFIATVNWGDGAVLARSNGAAPPITIVRSSSRPGLYEVRGSHTYARPGFYPLIVTLDGPFGATAILQGRALVYAPAATIRPVGRDFQHVGPLVADDRALATFTDSTPGATHKSYTAIVDWGDGVRKAGLVKQRRGGMFVVYGSHRYLDAERHSITVHIKRDGSPEEAVAWSSIELRGFTGPKYLPPFDKANITSIWSESPTKVYRGAATDIIGTLFLVNGGSKSTGKWRLRFWLSNDDTLEPETDKPLKFGPLNRLQTELKLNSLQAGGGGGLPIKEFGASDFTIRFPAAESGAGKFVLAEFVYTDPITDLMPVPKVLVYGPLEGVIVAPKALVIQEGQTGALGSGTFRVRLDTKPTSDVSVPIELVNNLGVVDNTRATLSTAQLVFTPTNATTEQTVTVTAVDDLKKNASTAFTVRLKPAVSSDVRFSNMNPADVALTIKDNIPTITVTPASLTVKEGDNTEPLLTAKFKVKLGSNPTHPVTIPLEITTAAGTVNNSRATLSVASLVINDVLEHEVTVTAVDDGTVNGTGTFTIKLKAATSTDTRFNGQDPTDVALTVQDNDTAP